MALTEKEQQTLEVLTELLNNPAEKGSELVKLISFMATPDSGVAVANIKEELSDEHKAMFERFFKKIMEKRYGAPRR